MSSPNTPVCSRTIDLDHEQLLVLDDHAGARIQVLFGGVWLTEESSLQDRFAAAGQWLALEGRGRAIAESIGPTRVRVLDAARRRSAAWRLALPRWRPSGDWIARPLAAVLALVMSIAVPEMLARGMHDTAVAPPSHGAALASVPPAAG